MHFRVVWAPLSSPQDDLGLEERFLSNGYGLLAVSGAPATGSDDPKYVAMTVAVRAWNAVGDPANARRVVEDYAVRLRAELGCEPGAALRALVTIA